MIGGSGRRRSTRRAVLLALLLVLCVLLVGANFVLVDVNLLVFRAEMRLGWVLLGSAAAGVLVGRLTRHRDTR